MRSLPTSIKEYEDNVRWVFHNYMELIEEIVCDPQHLRDRRTGRRGSYRARPAGRGARGR